MTCIVIVTFNGLKWLEKCIRSIDLNTYSVIVIDNASTDGTVKYLKESYPALLLYEQEQNMGFGRANNLGISIALKKGADFVFLLNQDAYLFKNTISVLIDTYKKHPEYGILSPIHLNGEGNKLDRNFAFYLEYDKNEYFYFDALHNKLKDVYDVPFVNAASWFLPKKTIQTIGGFDPIFFHYGEDDNYCQRVLFHGLKIGVVPKVNIIHDREFRENKKIKKFTSKYYDRMALNYKVKYANLNIRQLEENYISELKKIKKIKLKALIKLKLNVFNGYCTLNNILKNAYEEAQQSKSINIKKSSHYIDK